MCQYCHELYLLLANNSLKNCPLPGVLSDRQRFCLLSVIEKVPKPLCSLHLWLKGMELKVKVRSVTSAEGEGEGEGRSEAVGWLMAALVSCSYMMIV